MGLFREIVIKMYINKILAEILEKVRHHCTAQLTPILIH